MKEECSRCDKMFEVKVPNLFCSDCVDIIKNIAKKEVFDDFRALWKKCQNYDLRGLMLNDIEKLEEKHLKEVSGNSSHN